MSEAEIREMGPIDYIILEWPAEPSGDEVVPLLLDLVDRGTIKILDITFVTKDADGAMTAVEVGDLGPSAAAFSAFDGATSGLIDDDDLADAASALEPGTAAAILVWENLWAAPVATALRRSGGQLVASGRIPVQAIVAALDAAEERVSG
ncbi:hypothetical protein DSM104299_03912 [Baekduia alba]|uniref:DUF6325 family protein n=1 Tax=Baekduia alba TaxID=2997333 RepID=UPI002340DB4D|nr:DUF6325 family protein [Baekduia alba]WCB95169.1 hypothetical protein DSM104299_03912 [Baekduia alba]